MPHSLAELLLLCLTSLKRLHSGRVLADLVDRGLGLLLLAVLLLLFGFGASRLVRLALGGRDEGGLLQHAAWARGGGGDGWTGRACGRRGEAGLVSVDSQTPGGCLSG